MYLPKITHWIQKCKFSYSLISKRGNLIKFYFRHTIIRVTETLPYYSTSYYTQIEKYMKSHKKSIENVRSVNK